MEIFKADVVIVGGGGAGLRAAIAVAESDPSLKIALVSKVYPMRSHTVAAEGGAAGVKRDDDSFDYHFHDTVGGGDWLCEQDVVEYFVKQAPVELTQLEHWGCPWSRTEDGHVNVRPFGGMKIERTWFAADKSGFHILHTLFQTSIKYPSIKRFDEHFCVDLLEEDGRVQGVVVIEMGTGEFSMIQGKSVIIATGGAGRVFRESTLGGIVTGDGMALAFRHGVALRDMEFVQYHPTCMPITGLLFTEACRGEGGYLVNKDGYRYLQDYGLGPLQDKPKNKYMELGPRDRLSQAFYFEQQKGRTIEHPVLGSVVHLDLRHLGEAYLREHGDKMSSFQDMLVEIGVGKLLPVVIIIVGASEVFDSSLSVGALIGFQMLSGRVTQPLISIVGLVNEYQETALSVRMLGEVMNHPPERRSSGGLRPAFKGQIALDGVTDPQNLGAVIRSAAAFGANGVILPERRSASVTAAAWKVSAGAAAHMPVARVVNLTKAIESLKERGYYSVGLDGGGDALVGETGFETDPLVVVLGSEGNGLSRLVREACDSIAGIPMSNMVESLNASVAAGITLYAVARARREAAAAK